MRTNKKNIRKQLIKSFVDTLYSNGILYHFDDNIDECITGVSKKDMKLISEIVSLLYGDGLFAAACKAVNENKVYKVEDLARSARILCGEMENRNDGVDWDNMEKAYESALRGLNGN